MSEEKRTEEFYGSLVFNKYSRIILPGLLVISFIYGWKELVWISLSCLIIYLFSRFWAAGSLRNLDLEEFISSREVFPGEETELQFRISNHKRLPVPWLLVETDKVYQVGWISAQESLTINQTLMFPRRGVYKVGTSKMRSGDPFSLFCREKTLIGSTEVLVYPSILDYPWSDFGRKYPNGNIADPNVIFTDPAYKVGLKNYEPSDSLRSVNWAASAKYQDLKANIAEGKAVSRSILFLDAVSLVKRKWTERKKELAWEILVSGVASFALHVSSEDKEWSFTTNLREERVQQHQRIVTESNSTSSHHQLRLLLARLACINFTPEKISTEQQFLGTKGQSGATLIIFAAAYDAMLLKTITRTTQLKKIKWYVLDEQEIHPESDVQLLKTGWAEDEELYQELLG